MTVNTGLSCECLARMLLKRVSATNLPIQGLVWYVNVDYSILTVIYLFMASLCNREAIVFLSCGFFFYLLLLPLQIGCLPYFHTRCGASANLGCRPETCCTWLAGNAGRKKIAKNSPSEHHRTNLSGYIFTTKAHVGNRHVKQQYVLHVCPQYGELRLTNGWDLLASLGHPS